MASLNIIGIAAVALSGIALLFAILAVSLTWQGAELLNTKYTLTLWEFCSGDACTSIDDANSGVTDSDRGQTRAVRAMVMLGLLLSAGAIVVGVLVMFVMKEMKILYFVAAGLDIAAGLFLMIGMALYAVELRYVGYDFKEAFALDILAGILAWVAGGAFVGAKLTQKD